MPHYFDTKVGDRYGTRVITGFLRERDTDGHLRCVWKCDCGTTGTAGLKSLRHTKNCRKCRNQYQKGRPTHGHSRNGIGGRTRLYDAWANMMQRTRGTGSVKNKRWYSGISVCDAWQTFAGFHEWAMANGYAEGLSLDRVHSRGDYRPGNCEWVTRAENTRRATQLWRRHDSTPIEMLWGVA